MGSVLSCRENTQILDLMDSPDFQEDIRPTVVIRKTRMISLRRLSTWIPIKEDPEGEQDSNP